MKGSVAIFCLVTVVALFNDALAADVADSYGNRIAAARSYLDVVPPSDIVRGMAIEATKNTEDAKQQQQLEQLLRAINIPAVESIMMAAIAKTFTVEEINALKNFYGSPTGRAILKKWPTFWADTQPAMDQEVVRAARDLGFVK